LLTDASLFIAKHYLCAILKLNSLNMANNKEEYTQNKSRDWMVFIVSTVAMVAILWFKPEWVWVTWPFQFTALAGALGRL
jgi:hypothetical protein